MVRKTCKRCNNHLGDVHGNTKYCWHCRIEVRREKDRLRQQRQRDLKNKGTLIREDSRHDNRDVTSPSKTALELYQLETREEEVIRLLQKGLAPLFFEVNNRLARLETNQEELGHALSLSPQLLNQHSWKEFAIQRAMKLLEACEESLPLYRIRQILEKEILRTDKRTAEKILKEAMERIQWGKDRKQKKLDEFEDDGEGK